MAIPRSGVITVTTAGTEVQCPVTGPGSYLVKADPANTGFMYFGNDGNGAVANTTGYKMAAGDAALVTCKSLDEYWVDSSVNGEKVTWLKVGPVGSVLD